ncbi:MAG: type II toxin-antitoxin system PemK/MazF family toxin [Defluviitaleaceae bacterium]|nr:type II toxin-antitoxin system PemK/MazF family toxin [Defluviitaleaceae bacterium]
MVNGVPVQGDIIKINLNPKQGHEQQGYRPYICLSNKIISDIAKIDTRIKSPERQMFGAFLVIAIFVFVVALLRKKTT